jgi:glutathione S-transferase
VLNLKAQEHKEAWYKAINPMGKVPAVVHGDTVVTEVPAICVYLADIFPEAGLAPAIGDPRRGTYLRWMFFNAACVEPALIDHALKREPGPASTLSYGDYDTTVDTLASAVGPGPYLLGTSFSAADVVVGSGIRWTLRFKILPERPQFLAYAARLAERPALQRAIAKDEELVRELGG